MKARLWMCLPVFQHSLWHCLPALSQRGCSPWLGQVHLHWVKNWLGDWGQRVVGSGATSTIQSLVGLLLRAQFWAHFGLISLWMTWIRELRPRRTVWGSARPWVLLLGHHNPIQYFRLWAGWLESPSTGKSLQMLVNSGWMWAGCVQGTQESQWHPGLDQEHQSQQDQGSDCHSVLATGDATPQILGSVLGPALQERHWGAEACLEKSKGDGKGSGESVIEEWLRELGLFGLQKRLGGGTFSISTTPWQEGGARWGTEGNGLKLCHRGFRLNILCKPRKRHGCLVPKCLKNFHAGT